MNNTYQNYRARLALGMVSRLPALKPEKYIGLYSGVEDPVLKRTCYIFLDTALRCECINPMKICRDFELPEWVWQAFSIKRECPKMTFGEVLRKVDVEWFNLPVLSVDSLTAVDYAYLRDYKKAIGWLSSV